MNTSNKEQQQETFNLRVAQGPESGLGVYPIPLWSRFYCAVVLAANDEDDFAYVSVPPNRTFHVKTRYVYQGKGTPLPFELDDE